MEETYGENSISGILHADESSYHLHFLVCPVDHRINKNKQKIYKLNARAITGGTAKLQAIQDSYAKAVSTCGLKRGVKGSKASHTSIKQYYTALNESKKVCEESGLIAPTSDPESFNHWQEIVAKLANSIDEKYEDDIDKLKQIIQELIATNQRLHTKLQDISSVNKPYF